MRKIIYTVFTLLTLFSCTQLTEPAESGIDRYALVSRNNVKLSTADTLAALSVGNGNFAFTADISGLQSFPENYERGISLGTQSQWGWHSFPNEGDYVIDDVAVEYETCNNHRFPIAIQHKEGRALEATNWLRQNPHRLHLGIVGLVLIKENGEEAVLEDLKAIDQELDLWTGTLTSRYEVDGQPVEVVLNGHQDQDLIAFQIKSPLISLGRLKVKLRFPYGKDCHVCPGYDWDSPEKHTTTVIRDEPTQKWLERKLDETTYYVGLSWENEAAFEEVADHYYELSPNTDNDSFSASVLFSEDLEEGGIPAFEEVLQNSQDGMESFWTAGGAIDFSECTDPRAAELERRVVLSQYLTKIQCSGIYPPQETGLTFNSWYGKFHLEMHWWHGVHFALWDRIDLLENSMGWYQDIIDTAQAAAEWQGFEGVRWPKMTDPRGKSSPSGVGEFLVWQQPHPIYFAELFYRHSPNEETLKRYEEIVFKTAEFMVSFAQFDATDGKYHLCHPLIPAQEIFHATETDDPPFELAYWHYALSVAQKWRARLGLPPNEKWQEIIDDLAPLPVSDGLYLPCARAYTAYTDDDNRRDHPIVTGAYGMLPLSPMIDTTIMAATLDEILKKWNWQTTWGWDYPMLAMNAARLGKQDAAVDALLMDVQKNTYLPNGHNFQDQRLRLYLPGNGGLLTAVGMMAAGWDGSSDMPNPGFPQNGKWKVKWEGLVKMP